MSKLLDTVRTGKITSGLPMGGNAQVSRDGVRVDTPFGTIDTRSNPMHTFMKVMDDSGGYMRPTQFKVDFNIDPDFLSEKAVRPERDKSLLSSSPFAALQSMAQDAMDAVSDAVGDVFGTGSIGRFEALSLNCHSAQLPAETFSMSDTQKIDGVPRRHPVARAPAQEVPLSFYVSRGAFERAAILEWQNKVVSQSRHRVGYHDNYVKDIHIRVLSNDSVTTNISLTGDVEEQTSHEVILVNAWPAIINEMDLDYSSTGQIVSMNVVFYCDRAIWSEQRKAAEEENEKDNEEKFSDKVKDKVSQIKDTVGGFF